MTLKRINVHHYDILQNDTQVTGTKKNITKWNNINVWRKDNQHNGIQLNAALQNDIQLTDTVDLCNAE